MSRRKFNWFIPGAVSDDESLLLGLANETRAKVDRGCTNGQRGQDEGSVQRKRLQ